MVYKRLWYSHKFSQVFMIRPAITRSYYSQLLSLLNQRTWYLFRAYWSLWCLRVFLLLLCSCTGFFFINVIAHLLEGLLWIWRLQLHLNECMKSGLHMFNSYSHQVHAYKCINFASQEYIDPYGNSISEPIGHTFIILILRVIL
jgi:hypothetical protein